MDTLTIMDGDSPRLIAHKLRVCTPVELVRYLASTSPLVALLAKEEEQQREIDSLNRMSLTGVVEPL